MTSNDERPATAPHIIICDDAEAAAERTSRIIADAIAAKPAIVLGLATGGTPIDAYRHLVRFHREQGLDFSSVTSFNLDEYVGLGADHPQSFRYFMQHHLFDHVNIDPAHTHVPDGLAADVAQHAQQYEGQIRAAGGIDLQLLGIGSNGHIAFNEPGSTIDSRTRQVDLTAETIDANARFFDTIEDVPRTAITMGIGTILDAKQIVLMAIGQRKAEIVARAVGGKPDPACPASLLQLHRDVTYVVDSSAARLL